MVTVKTADKSVRELEFGKNRANTENISLFSFMQMCILKRKRHTSCTTN